MTNVTQKYPVKNQTMKKFQIFYTASWAICYFIIFIFSLSMCQWNLIYNIDDSYIELSVANNIINGGYGINYNEFSSPSSSILYPFILAFFVFFGAADKAPLIINTIATGISVWILSGFFWRFALESQKISLSSHVFCAIVIFLINPFFLPFTGMEHSLHVLSVIVAMVGLINLVDHGRVSIWLVITASIMPFIRFEGTALSMGIVLILAISGFWRLSVSVLVCVLGGFAAWAIFMNSLMLPFLPSSVLLKLNLPDTNTYYGFIKVVVSGLHRSYQNSFGLLFLLLLCWISAFAQSEDGRLQSIRSEWNIIAIPVIFALTAHVVLGKYGSWGRYEVYAVAIATIGGIYLGKSKLMSIINTSRLSIQLSVISVMTIIAMPYFMLTLLTPLASKGIYEQQYQMHRFVTEFFQHNVAVNDLGLVSYKNKNYVLDIYGLGSEEIRKLRQSHNLTESQIDRVSSANNIDFAMIYREWFNGVIPIKWKLKAILHTTAISAAHGDVDFYVINPAIEREIDDALVKFSATLPPATKLTIK